MNDTPHDSGPDAAARGDRQRQPSARTGPWTGAGPIIRNPPNPAQPYGAPADEPSTSRRQRSLARRAAVWLVAALVIIALVAVGLAGLLAAF